MLHLELFMMWMISFYLFLLFFFIYSYFTFLMFLEFALINFFFLMTLKYSTAFSLKYFLLFFFIVAASDTCIGLILLVNSFCNSKGGVSVNFF